MSNAYQKAVGNKGMLDRLIQKLPGYGGYLDRDARQEADRIHREFIANALFSKKSVVAKVLEELISAAAIGDLDKYEKISKRLDMLANKIRSASYGSAAFFSSSTLGEEELRRLHEFDMGLVDCVEEIDHELDALLKAVSDEAKRDEKRRAVLDVLERVEEHFGRREEIIKKG